MQQRVQMIRRRPQPSSAAQLPITVALHAENLTLFDDYSTTSSIICKSPFWEKISILLIHKKRSHPTAGTGAFFEVLSAE